MEDTTNTRTAQLIHSSQSSDRLILFHPTCTALKGRIFVESGSRQEGTRELRATTWSDEMGTTPLMHWREQRKKGGK